MSEFDPKALEHVLDLLLPVPQEGKHIGSGEVEEPVARVLAMIHTKPRPKPGAVIAKIDSLTSTQTILSPVGLVMAAVLRRLAEIAAAQPESEPPVASLISDPPPVFDWGAASDGCVEGGGLGGIGGAELGSVAVPGFGSVPGWVLGALGGCVAGGLIKGFGHGRGSQGSGTGGGGSPGEASEGGAGGSGKK